MDKKLVQIIDESIYLELNVSRLYRIFAFAFSEYYIFWWRLVMEEQNHAALLKSVKECFVPINRVPIDLLAPEAELLKDSNNKIELLIKAYELNPPSLTEAFNTAYAVEQSAGEIHYQTFMEKRPEQPVEKIFQKLNGDDKDHAQRIISFMSPFQGGGSGGDGGVRGGGRAKNVRVGSGQANMLR